MKKKKEFKKVEGKRKDIEKKERINLRDAEAKGKTNG